MAITGKQIWEALKKDDEYMAQGLQHEVPARIFQEYIENTLLDVLGHLLDEPAILYNILHAGAIFHENAYSAGLFSRIIKEIPGGIPEDGFFITTLRDLMEKTGETLQIEVTVNEFKIIMETFGYSEEDLYEELGFDKETIAKAMRGEITIGDILLSRPGAILQL